MLIIVVVKFQFWLMLVEIRNKFKHILNIVISKLCIGIKVMCLKCHNEAMFWYIVVDCHFYILFTFSWCVIRSRPAYKNFDTAYHGKALIWLINRCTVLYIYYFLRLSSNHQLFHRYSRLWNVALIVSFQSIYLIT